jgi:acetyl esterase/lipase
MSDIRSHRRRRFASSCVVTAAILLVFLTVWIVAPAPNTALLTLAVGAPEVSPWLTVASAIVLLFAIHGARAARAMRRRSAIWGVSAALSAVALMLSASPLVRLPSTIARFDAALAAGLGADVMRAVPSDIVARLRPRVLTLRELARGLVSSGDMTIARNIEFSRPAGQSLRLDIYRPSASGRYPIVIQIYGGAWQRGAPADNSAFARSVAALGFVVIAIDYRHAPQWRWPAQIDDVRSALAWIAQHAREYDGDTSRVALVGRSSGGQLATLAAYEGKAVGMTVKAVVSYYAPVDLADGYRHPPSPDPLDVRAVLETYLGATPDDTAGAERYRAASPITYVTRTAPPTLLIYGTRDHIVQAHYGRVLDRRLREAGATSILPEIPWAEHAFDVLPGGLSGQLSLYYTQRFLAAVL